MVSVDDDAIGVFLFFSWIASSSPVLLPPVAEANL